MRIPRASLYPGALYHVMQRGHRRGALFHDDLDRREFLWVLGSALEREGARLLAYCLMDNHVHLLIWDREARLPSILQRAFGNYGRRFAARRGLQGRVFQGRPRQFVITDERYLSAVIRYIVLNPVAAGMVRHPAEWPWSSHGAMTGSAPAPKWFARERALEGCGGSVAGYEELVLAGIGAAPLRWERIGRPV